jgi:hypothetical protein
MKLSLNIVTPGSAGPEPPDQPPPEPDGLDEHEERMKTAADIISPIEIPVKLFDILLPLKIIFTSDYLKYFQLSNLIYRRHIIDICCYSIKINEKVFHRGKLWQFRKG